MMKLVLFATLATLAYGAPNPAPQESHVQQTVETTKVQNQAVPTWTVGWNGVPYLSNIVQPAQVKTTTTHQVSSKAAPVVATAPLVASAPVVATAGYASPVVAASPAVAYTYPYTYGAYTHGWPSAWTSNYAYTSPLVATTSHAYTAPVVSSAALTSPLVSSVYGYPLYSPYSNYLLLKKKK